MQKTLDELEAFYNGVVEDNYDFVKAFIGSKVKSTEQAADLTQEVFTEAFKHLSELQTHDNIRGWLIQTAKHKIGDFQRRCERSPVTVNLDEITEVLGHIDKYQEDDFSQSLSCLKPSDAAILTYFYKDELSIREIAQTLHITEWAAKTQLSRARKRLAKII